MSWNTPPTPAAVLSITASVSNPCTTQLSSPRRKSSPLCPHEATSLQCKKSILLPRTSRPPTVESEYELFRPPPSAPQWSSRLPLYFIWGFTSLGRFCSIIRVIANITSVAALLWVVICTTLFLFIAAWRKYRPCTYVDIPKRRAFKTIILTCSISLSWRSIIACKTFCTGFRTNGASSPVPNIWIFRQFSK